MAEVFVLKKPLVREMLADPRAETVQGAGDGSSLWPAVDSEAPAGGREQSSAGTVETETARERRGALSARALAHSTANVLCNTNHLLNFVSIRNHTISFCEFSQHPQHIS